MFDFVDRFNKLNFTDEEVVIFFVIVFFFLGNKDIELLKIGYGSNFGKNINYVEYFNVLCILYKS